MTCSMCSCSEIISNCKPQWIGAEMCEVCKPCFFNSCNIIKMIGVTFLGLVILIVFYYSYKNKKEVKK
jgi:hypothetical protein